MKTFDSETQKVTEPKQGTSFRLPEDDHHFQELLVKVLKEERREVQKESKKENRLIFFLSLFIFFIALFQTFSFFILYREIKALQPPTQIETEQLIPPHNPPIPKEEIIQPLLKKLPPRA